MTSTPIAAQILAHLIDRVGQRDWLALTEADRSLVESCCVDAARLQLDLLAAGSDASLQTLLQREKNHIAAQFANMSAASRLALQTALWETVSQLLIRVGTVLVAV